MRAGRLGRLPPAHEIGAVHAQQPHVLDARDLMHDAVQLALVERAAELPAVAVVAGRAADERVEEAVELAQRLLADADEVGQWLGLQLDDDADPAQAHGRDVQRRAEQAALVEMTGDLLEQVARRLQLVELQAAVGRVQPRQDPHGDGVALVGRHADGARDARRGLPARYSKSSAVTAR